MIKLSLIFVLILIQSTTYSQKIDSLKILRKNDWYTLNWLDKDTVCFISKQKIDTIYDGLTIEEKWNKAKQNFYGERISYDSGDLEYSYTMACPVGEFYRKINSINFTNNIVIIEYQTRPWNDQIWALNRREFEIIKWSSKCIILK